ncbi:MAG: hypothetical protein R3F59_25565 [Myxococcota bacterium]
MHVELHVQRGVGAGGIAAGGAQLRPKVASSSWRPRSGGPAAVTRRQPVPWT